MSDKRLKSFADRLDALEEERKGIVGDIKDVFTEVSSAGYNAKALRKVLAARRKKTDAELEADMELYRAALAEPGATYRSVAERHGIPKTNLHRLVPKSSRGTGGGQPDSGLGAAAGDKTVAPATPAPKPEDGDDGITGGEREATDRGRDHAGVVEGAPVGEVPAADEGCATDPDAGKPEGGESRDGWRSGEVGSATPSVGAVAAEPRVATSTHITSQHVGCDYKMAATPFLGEDPGEPPVFLRSRTAQGRGA